VVKGRPDYTIGILIEKAFGYTDKIPVYEIAPWTGLYNATPADRAEADYGAILTDIKGRAIVSVHDLPTVEPGSGYFNVNLGEVLGAALSKTNPVNVRLSDGSVDIPLPTALDTGALKIKEQGTVTVQATDLDIRDLTTTERTPLGSHGDAFLQSSSGRLITQPVGSLYELLQQKATTYELLTYDSYVATLLAGGLPSTLDTDALKIKEQSPITSLSVSNFPSDYPDSAVATLLGGGLPTALVSDKLKVRASEVETLLAGGLPSALSSDALKIREQNPLTTIDVGNLPADYPDASVATLLGGGLPSALDTDRLKVRAAAIETLLAGGLPSALDTDSLKVIEQSPITSLDVDNFPADYPDAAALTEVTQSTTPTLYNVTMTSADTEYSQAHTGTVRRFEISTQDRSAFRFAWATGKVAGPTAPYRAIAANETYYQDMVKMTNPTFYFASASAGKVAELEVWT
jgi:hypothetical protein